MSDLQARIRSYILMYKIPAVQQSIPLAMLTPYSEEELNNALTTLCKELALEFQLVNNDPAFPGTGRIEFRNALKESTSGTSN